MTDEERAQIKQQSRADFPHMAGVVDKYRAVFGEGTKLLWARENGKELGRRRQGTFVVASVPLPAKPEPKRKPRSDGR